MQQYRAKEWFLFRKHLLELAENHCENCGRGPAQGAVIQIHHKVYIPSRKPWEYSPDQCSVLCKGCHAKEHGLIQPTSDWEISGEDDLGGLDGICDYCGNEIRYVFFITHPKWQTMAVGTNCCDRLTRSTQATGYLNQKKRFLISNRWRRIPDDSGSVLLHKGIRLEIISEKNVFRITADGQRGKLTFSSEREARQALFNLLFDGTIQSYLASKNQSRL